MGFEKKIAKKSPEAFMFKKQKKNKNMHLAKENLFWYPASFYFWPEDSSIDPSSLACR